MMAIARRRLLTGGLPRKPYTAFSRRWIVTLGDVQAGIAAPMKIRVIFGASHRIVVVIFIRALAFILPVFRWGRLFFPFS